MELSALHHILNCAPGRPFQAPILLPSLTIGLLVPVLANTFFLLILFESSFLCSKGLITGSFYGTNLPIRRQIAEKAAAI
jgi:hypothetical protein